ncbi:MAG TPA: hypothetical protein VFY93_04375 [Planctomycetota bacterium]|nr:hypothetical protein [Planctomycetota bacterium]
MDQREKTAVLERNSPPAPQHVAQPSGDDARRAHGIRDLVGGATLIGIGLLFGGSIFTGNPSALDWMFDGLGVFWIAKGVYQIATAKSTASV